MHCTKNGRADPASEGDAPSGCDPGTAIQASRLHRQVMRKRTHVVVAKAVHHVRH